MMKTIEILFWIALAIVFYTYAGYGIFLYLLVRVKEALCKRTRIELPEELPEVTLLIAAYNEEAVIADKMRNCRALDYPAGRLKIVWVTDGSNDRTNELLAGYPEVTVLFAPERRGKTAALNRGVPLVTTPLVVFTDANTMLGPEAIREIIRPFGDSKVGCVAGEKRVVQSREQAAASTEGIYWKYESKLKEWDDRLYTAVGAAGELFAIRRELFVAMPDDTLARRFHPLDAHRDAGLPDRLLQKRLRARRGLGRHDRRGQAQSAYRGRRAAIHRRLAPLLNPLRYGILWWQYLSHRILRWSVTPILLFALVPLNIALVAGGPHRILYGTILLLQAVFYGCALQGYRLSQRKIKNKLLFVPYYFLFMNLNVLRGHRLSAPATRPADRRLGKSEAGCLNFDRIGRAQRYSDIPDVQGTDWHKKHHIFRKQRRVLGG